MLKVHITLNELAIEGDELSEAWPLIWLWFSVQSPNRLCTQAQLDALTARLEVAANELAESVQAQQA